MYIIKVNTKKGEVWTYACSCSDEMDFLVKVLDKSKDVFRIYVLNEYGYYINPVSSDTTKVCCPIKQEIVWRGL